VISGTVSFLLFSTLPTALVLSLDVKTNRTISCTLLAISVPVKDAVLGLNCVTLGKYASFVSYIIFTMSLVAQWLIFIKLDIWRVRGKGIFSFTCRVPREQIEFGEGPRENMRLSHQE
jgi:hypothetical protein